jgi:adenylosuccinate lyase
VFGERIARSWQNLAGVAILGKFNGASGNYNATMVAYPEVDWAGVSRQFVDSLGFQFNERTTQIEPHDWQVRFANELALGNSIMTDLARDMWLYISMGYLKLKVKKEEVGSSTMPHKVNPIDFEKSESNFGTANALLGSLAARLPISRLQRDLSDSSTQRTWGTALGHTTVAHSALNRGLGKIDANEDKTTDDLCANWAVLTEPVQVVMRRYGVQDAYDQIKYAVRGQEFSESDYMALVEGLDIPADAKTRLLQLTPHDYTGMAQELSY